MFHTQTPNFAASAARVMRSSLSRMVWSSRFRERALAKICATSCSRFTSTVRPLAFLLQCTQSQDTKRRPSAHRERDGQIRLDTELAQGVRVAGGFRRQGADRSDLNDVPRQQFLFGPGVLVLGHPIGRLRALQGAVEVSEFENTRGFVRPLPEGRKIKTERLAKATLGVFNLPVDLARRKIDEFRGNVGDQCRFFLASAPSGAVDQQTDDQGGFQGGKGQDPDDQPAFVFAVSALIRNDVGDGSTPGEP